MMTPWRVLATPHSDVLNGTFQQAEFAADISAVHSGKAPHEYQDAVAFFERTYITEGMRMLLTQVAQRISGKGGEPVIQLQTAFGGGKTHTMLAVLHLASQKVPLSELAGIPSLIEQAGLMDVPVARVAVLDGAALSPGQAWKHGKTAVKTLWGELAWQLGGAEGFAMVKEADVNGTSPGKELLRELLQSYAPCVVLMDELVVFIRQLEAGKSLSGGSYDSNLSFIQSLTEAVKQVPTAVVLASLPDSRNASSGDLGSRAILALEHIVGRVQALWKPVATEEGFEIVRRRLFTPITDTKGRDAVCRAFADVYLSEGAKLPAETQESRYLQRLTQAYPIHPEVFDRLYEDWTTIEGFQRTRGVLKLMAKVIYQLWIDNNQDAMILPGSIPLAARDVRNEMVYLLTPGWEPVIEKDIDGDRAETTELETKEPRFGQVNAARRVARTLFLGTAPSSVGMKPGIRGLDRGRVLLGCLQPGQASALYSDALNRLSDRLHYLNNSGDKAADATRYWFDTRANLRREMEERKRRFDEKTDVRKRIEKVVEKMFINAPLFDGVHTFTAHADVPDDSFLRLVILPPESTYTKEDGRNAIDLVHEYLRNHGNQPRKINPNRLLFVAADQGVLSRLKEATRVALAWASIVEDVEEKKLNIDQYQFEQAKKELSAANDVLPRAGRECFRWLLCPAQDDPTATKPNIEPFPMNTSGSGAVGAEIERLCNENELVIREWAPIHLRTQLQKLYWKDGKTAFGATAFWEDSQKYIFLPRLKTQEVLARAIQKGATSREFFGTAEGQSGSEFVGFRFGEGNVTFDRTLLLIEPEAARAYALAVKKIIPVDLPESRSGGSKPDKPDVITPNDPAAGTIGRGTATTPVPRAKLFQGAVEVSSTTAKLKMSQIADEIISVLMQDPNAKVKITVEIVSEFPNGVSDSIKRAVSENATSLSFKTKDWE